MEKSRAILIAAIVIIILAIVSFAYISGNSHDTKIKVLSNSTLKSGDFIEMQLTDDYRNVYPGEVIDVKILDDSGWANKYQATTDENGKAKVELVTFENGNYTVHCNYNGTLFNKQTKTVVPLVIDDGY
jgi:ABC-type molybdate transport system substrate-binding protein